jgi:hypothetical protein
MGDYVLESNPALGRLIERLGTQSETPARKQSSSSSGSTRYRRRRRAKASKRVREDPTIVVAKKPAKSSRVTKPARLADALAVEDDLWALREDSGADEMVLVGFDEEPAIFAEEIGDGGDDVFRADEADEILDVYGRADLDEYGEPADEDAESFDERSVQAISAVQNEEGDWIIDAFKAWMLEAVEAPG